MRTWEDLHLAAHGCGATDDLWKVQIDHFYPIISAVKSGRCTREEALVEAVFRLSQTVHTMTQREIDRHNRALTERTIFPRNIVPDNRLCGTVVEAHPSADRYGGTFGEIAGEDGKTYTFNGGHVFRNCSRASVGAKVLFTVVNFSYATDIDQVDKEPLGSAHGGVWVRVSDGH